MMYSIYAYVSLIILIIILIFCFLFKVTLSVLKWWIDLYIIICVYFSTTMVYTFMLNCEQNMPNNQPFTSNQRFHSFSLNALKGKETTNPSSLLKLYYLPIGVIKVSFIFYSEVSFYRTFQAIEVNNTFCFNEDWIYKRDIMNWQNTNHTLLK